MPERALTEFCYAVVERALKELANPWPDQRSCPKIGWVMNDRVSVQTINCVEFSGVRYAEHPYG
jgi:hypothetical protein